MDFNIDKEVKREILLTAKTRHEENVYASICNLGLDPDSFDPDNTAIEGEEALSEELRTNLAKLAMVTEKLEGLDA